ncbi:maltokinase N-terminal cap-like domain-containing protein [Microlunatus ginsengisoli]|uniref:Maltokinase n=1 Tax=Microlunatus ginsengisoli TaxID=363863 RepID=A0ABP6ZJ18_9ACTN
MADDQNGQLLNAISRARWFAGKGRRAELTGHTRLGWLTDLDQWPAVRLEIIEISYPPDEDPEPAEGQEPGMRAEPVDAPGSALRQAQGTSGAIPYELYQVPVSYHRAPVPELAHAELARLDDADLGSVVGYDATQDPAACRILLTALLDARRVREPDSEVRFTPTDTEGLSADDDPQPFRGQQSNTSIMFGETAMLKVFRRLELGRNLDIETHEALNKAGVADVARLYGWIDAGWRHHGHDVRADLGMLVEKLIGAEDGWGLALDVLAQGRSFAEESARLGRALAEIHAALRDAFPVATTSGERTAQTMTERFEVARAIAPALDAYADGVLATFGRLGAGTLDVQRVHGDFHLGQTLRTPAGWKIIDFEGEPAKTLAERLEPDSVWRDIAGMLRSFDYAGASVPGPGSAAWVADCRTAFLDAYAGGGLDADDAAVLRAYETDKAVYEVVYEVRNRPDWVHIPVGAVAALSEQTPSGTQAVRSDPTGDKE